MPHSFYCLCPNCLSEDSFTDSICNACGAQAEFNHHGIQLGEKHFFTAEYYQFLQTHLTVERKDQRATRLDSDARPLRKSGAATLLRGDQLHDFSGYHRIFRTVLENPRPVASGYLQIFPDHIEFCTDAETFRWELKAFSCVTTNGHRFEFRTAGQPFYQIEFESESELKYEILFRKWLQAGYQRLGRNEIYEFQPHIRDVPLKLPRRIWDVGPRKQKEPRYLLERLVMGGFARFVRLLLLPFVRVEIAGRDVWAGFERGIVIANHQSAADGFILGAHLDHHIAWLTKSTSFGSWFPRNFLKWTLSIPTTRYRTDVAVIRFVRSTLEKGIRVGVFPEGERCWDGQIKPFRRGTVKMLIAARQPLYPVVFKGAFEFWPRWASKPGKSDIRIVICPPFSLLPDRASVDEHCQFLEAYFREILAASESIGTIP